MIQIPETLFIALCRYHLLDIKDAEIEAMIQIELQDKLERAARRQQYTKRLQAQAAQKGDE